MKDNITEITEKIAKITAAIVLFENMIAVMQDKNTKKDKYIEYACSVLQDAKNREYEKQSVVAREFAELVAKNRTN